MKITKNRLKQIIKEEIGALTEEDESIEDLMNTAGYEKAKDAIKSAIDFDEKVEDMKDLKDLIKTLGSEKDPMGNPRDEELNDIKNALKAALRKRNISEAMSNDRYNELVKAIRKDPNLPKDEQDELIGILNELITPTRLDVDEKFITLDVLKAIRKDPRYREGETIDADAAGAYSIPGFLRKDDVINLAKKLRVDKNKEKSYLSEKLKGNTKMNITKNRLKQIIKEEIEALGEQEDSSAEDYRKKIKGFAKTLEMVENAPEEMRDVLGDAMKHSVKMSVEDVLNRIADDSVRDGVKMLVVDLLGQEYLPQSKSNMDEPMNESVGRLKQIIKEEIENLSK